MESHMVAAFTIYLYPLAKPRVTLLTNELILHFKLAYLMILTFLMIVLIIIDIILSIEIIYQIII